MRILVASDIDPGAVDDLKAIEETLATLADKRDAASVDPDIATVDRVFELVNTEQAIAHEKHVGQH